MIPYAQTYTATMRGRTLKQVNCEQCQAEYVYFMEREATGQGTSVLFLDNEGAEGRASSDAERSLDRALAQECDPVPCPGCAWYQKPMVTMLRKQHRAWMFWTGVAFFIPTLLAGFVLYINLVDMHGPKPHLTSWSLGILLSGLTASLGLIFLRRILAANYDPNSDDLETRKQIAAGRSMLKQDLERILEEERRAEGNLEGAE